LWELTQFIWWLIVRAHPVHLMTHCESSPSSSDDCGTAPSGCRPADRVYQLELLIIPVGCYRLHPPLPSSITQPESWYSVYIPCIAMDFCLVTVLSKCNQMQLTSQCNATKCLFQSWKAVSATARCMTSHLIRLLLFSKSALKLSSSHIRSRRTSVPHICAPFSGLEGFYFRPF